MNLKIFTIFININEVSKNTKKSFNIIKQNNIMSALNDFYEKNKFEFTEPELDEMEIEFLEIVSNKFENTSEVELDCEEGSSDEVFWLTQMKINVSNYEIIVRGDDDGTPVIDIVYDSNILGVYYPKNISEFVKYINELVISLKTKM